VESPESSAGPPPEQPAEPPPPAAESASPPAEDLPEWEPLSPELLEDEAIRGDFVLRWAVVGLALLFGCSQLSDPRPLVHVRTGEWLATHGVLPTGTEPFSIAAAERRWTNLTWLFDLLVAGVNAVSGTIGLSVFQGILALVAFAFLGHTYRSGIRTWWGSVCAALALLAAMARLNVTPELITLCGTAITLWLLVRCEENKSVRSWWWFVPLMWTWSQLDSRAWMGAVLLLLYLIGSTIGNRSPNTISALVPWKPIVAAVAVMVIHPFLWESWLSPYRLYATEYPALREAYPRPTIGNLAWYPLWSSLLWQQFDFRLTAGLILFVAAAAALWLERARVSASHLMMFAGANIIGAVALHDFPVAAFVNCVLATVHGQGWFLGRFGQVYSVNWPEVLFSRAGRAMTVLGLFALAWLALSGRIDGPDGRRSGVGLDRQLQAELDSFHRLSSFTGDDRAFHLALRQGDALIAAGRKSFVDHRVQLFTGAADRNLLAKHDSARRSLRRQRPDDTLLIDPFAWKDLFQEYKLSHALPRLTVGASVPDYDTFMELLSQPDWALIEVLPATAVFYWARSPEPAVRQFATSHALNILDEAFRKPQPVSEQPHDHPQPPPWSQQLFSMPRRQPGGGTLLASHWMRLVTALQGTPWPLRAGGLTIAIRAAQDGVRQTPDVPIAYDALSEAYVRMGQVEAQALLETGLPWNTSLRYYQAVAAAQDAIRLDSHDLTAHSLLLQLYREAGRVDAAHDAVQALIENTSVADPSNEMAVKQREFLLQLEESLNRDTNRLADRAQQQLDQQADRLQVASAVYQAGGIKRAASILQEDAVYVETHPAARQLLTAALAELGRGTELDESASRLEAVGERAGLQRWRDQVAVAALGRTDYTTAIKQWDRELSKSDDDQLQGLLYTAPLATSSPFWLGDLGYPTPHSVIAIEGTQRRLHDQAVMELYRAVCEIERSQPDRAAAALRSGLQRAPSSPLRPLMRYYLFCIAGESVDAEPPADWIPTTPDMFAAD